MPERRNPKEFVDTQSGNHELTGLNIKPTKKDTNLIAPTSLTPEIDMSQYAKHHDDCEFPTIPPGYYKRQPQHFPKH